MQRYWMLHGNCRICVVQYSSTGSGASGRTEVLRVSEPAGSAGALGFLQDMAPPDTGTLNAISLRLHRNESMSPVIPVVTRLSFLLLFSWVYRSLQNPRTENSRLNVLKASQAHSWQGNWDSQWYTSETPGRKDTSYPTLLWSLDYAVSKTYDYYWVRVYL